MLRRVLRTFATVLTTAGVIAAVGLIAVLVVVPRAVGGMSLTILSGSMRPGIQPGDVVVTRGVDAARLASLQVGDVITFMPYPDDPTLVTHRVVATAAGIDGISFVTKGDDNNDVDPWGPVHEKQIVGQVMFHVPYVGWVKSWLGDNAQLVLVGAAVCLMGGGVVGFVRSSRRPKPEPKATARRVLVED